MIIYLLFILLLSIGLNILCFAPYFSEYYEKIKNKMVPVKYFSIESKDSEVIKSVVESSMIMNGSSFKQGYPKNGLFHDVRYLLRAKRVNHHNFFHLSYLYVGLSYYAKKYNDQKVLNYLESIQKKFVSEGKLRYKITVVDQVPIGLLYINLYRITKKADYFNICVSIFNYIDSLTTKESNIISYRENAKNHYVDSLGMIIPFLVEFAKLSESDSLAYRHTRVYQIAKDNVEEFCKYGCDNKTGVPVHGYNKDSLIKLGSANWGRGIGWYLLALSYMPEFNQDLLDSNIKYMNYSQFPLSDVVRFDSSAALMFELYKRSRGISDTQSIAFIKQHITCDGFIASCSGDTYGFNRYSTDFGLSELTNGLFLMLISRF